MDSSKNTITLEIAERRALRMDFIHYSDLVQCQALAMLAGMEVACRKPEKLEEMKKNCEQCEKRIQNHLEEFQRVLEKTLQLESRET